jgi:diguanylate cyclase (GGDEF)-like protein
MGPLALILVCDHRGEGLAEALRPLAALGYRLEIASSVRESGAKLATTAPDLIVLDPLAGGGSLELSQVREALARPAPPIRLVADPANPLPAVLSARGLGAAAHDVVRRDAPFEEFLMRIDRVRRMAAAARELDEMRYRAAHDDRTELLRPATFQERLREHFAAAQRHRFDLALVLLDLDDFRVINKQHDHTVGDAVIERVGGVIRDSLRTEDVGGRIGGDEFAVVLPYTRRVDAARVVQRLRDAIAALTGRIATSDGREVDVRISASLGFETYDGSDLDSLSSLRRRAECALRAAKERGGGCAIYFRSLDGEPSAAHQDRP